MSRASRAVSEKIEPVQVGDHDPVSRAAFHARIELCRKNDCTRPAGHTESIPGHPSTDHVVADIKARTFVALEVWS